VSRLKQSSLDNFSYMDGVWSPSEFRNKQLSKKYLEKDAP
jgi:hypothetical protein